MVRSIEPELEPAPRPGPGPAPTASAVPTIVIVAIFTFTGAIGAACTFDSAVPVLSTMLFSARFVS